MDLDADGDIDLIAPGRSGLYWLENRLGPESADSHPPQELAATGSEDHTQVLVYRDASGQTADRPVGRRVGPSSPASTRRSGNRHGLLAGLVPARAARHRDCWGGGRWQVLTEANHLPGRAGGSRSGVCAAAQGRSEGQARHAVSASNDRHRQGRTGRAGRSRDTALRS